jgi:hypothetical protein
VKCGGKSCPTEIVQECIKWASEVETATPSVVLAARDSAGHELTDVVVSIDGGGASSAGARATVLDPGLHTFTFKRVGHADIIEQVVLHEGEKNREILARYAAPETPTPEGGSRPVPTTVWMAGSLSVTGFALFATFGALGVSARSTDHCATGCTSSQNNNVATKFDIADVSLGVGIAALGVAAWQFFARPTVPRASAARVLLQPLPGGGIVTLSTRW